MKKRRNIRVRRLFLSAALALCVSAGCVFSAGADAIRTGGNSSTTGTDGDIYSTAGGGILSVSDDKNSSSTGESGASSSGGADSSMIDGSSASGSGEDSRSATGGDNSSDSGGEGSSATGRDNSSDSGEDSRSADGADNSSGTGVDGHSASGGDSASGTGGDEHSPTNESLPPTSGGDASSETEADQKNAPVITAVMTGTHPFFGRYYTNAQSANLTITFSGTDLRPEMCTATVGELETKCAADTCEREEAEAENPRAVLLSLAHVGSAQNLSQGASTGSDLSTSNPSQDNSANSDQNTSNPSPSTLTSSEPSTSSSSQNTSTGPDQNTSNSSQSISTGSDPSASNPPQDTPGDSSQHDSSDSDNPTNSNQNSTAEDEEPRSYSISFSEEELRALNDGEIRITATAEDSAGRVTRSFSDDSEGLEINGATDRVRQDLNSEENGKDDTDDAYAAFVLDRTAPVCEVSVISPESANQELQGAGNRYYFNRAFLVSVSVTDDTAVVRETLSIGRASCRNVTGSNAEVAFGENDYLEEDLSAMRTGDGQLWSDFEAQWKALNDAHSGSRPDGFPGTVSAVWTETVSPDPEGSNEVFQYLITGSDCAGNAFSPVYSAPAVLDTEAPQGAVTITDRGGVFYAAMTAGGVSVLEPYRKETDASVRLETSGSEHSPVRMAWSTEASPRAGSQSGQSEGYAFGQTAVFRQSGRQQFRLTSFVLTDLAGNQTAFRGAPEIYLDADPPENDVLGPAISVRTGTDGEKGEDSCALYRDSVPIRVRVKEPYAGEGSSGLGDVTLTVSMDGRVLEKETKTLHRAAGRGDTDHSGKSVYELTHTETIEAKTHEGGTICVRVAARDNAGNESEAFANFRIDATPPAVSVRYGDDNARNGKYFREARTAELTVIDRSFDPSGIRIDTNESAVRGVWKRVAPTNAWVSVLTFREDGRYSLSVACTDLAGNESRDTSYSGAAPRDFIIDTKPPRITLAYDGTGYAKGHYFHSSRVGFILVDDENFGGENSLTVSGGETSGQTGISFSEGKCTVLFNKDGTYRLSGTVTDLAGNVSKPLTAEEFVIDTKKPELTISGVKDRSSNREPVSIEISASDPNMSGSSLTYTLSRQRPGEESQVIREGISTGFVRMSSLDRDGLYVLKAQAEDLAGNRTEKSISFTENQAGTSFAFVQEDMRNACTNRLFRPAFILQNIDAVKILSVTVNGREVSYTFRKNRLTVTGGIKKDGRYVIHIDTRDAAGNHDSMSPVVFTLDRTPPNLTVRGLKHGAQIYYEPFDVTLIRESPDDMFSELEVDGRAVENPKLNEDGSVTFRIDTPGAHVIRAGLTDSAGNAGPVRTIRVVLTDNAALRWFMNRAGFCASIAAAAALAVWLFIRRKAYASH